MPLVSTINAESATAAPVRLAWPDHAKALGIVLVVLCHTADGVFAALGQHRPPVWNEVIDLSYSFMVPIFFAVSGWLLERSGARHRPRSQIGKIAANILWPYALWTVAQTAMMIITRAGNTVPLWTDLPRFLVAGAMQFWFLRALAIAWLLDLALRGLGLPARGRLLLGVVLLVGFSFAPQLGGAGTALPALHYIYFAAGAWWFQATPKPLTKPVLIAMSIGGSALMLLFHFAGLRCDTAWRPFTAFAGIAATFGAASLLPASGLLRWMSLTGAHSLPIYCMHVIVAAAARILLLKAGITAPAILIFAGTALAILLPLMLSSAGSSWTSWMFRFPRINPSTVSSSA